MGDDDASARTGLAARARRWLTPTPRWPPGFIDLPRADAPVRQPGGADLFWAAGSALVVSAVGYAVARAGMARVTSGALSTALPAWWLAAACAFALTARWRGAGAPSPRVAVVRAGAVALLGALSGVAVALMLSHWEFAPVLPGPDEPRAPLGAGLGCVVPLAAPFAIIVSLAFLRQGSAAGHRGLRALTVASMVALAALVVGAAVRHLRAPNVVSWINRPPETQVWLVPRGGREVDRRGDVHGLTVELVQVSEDGRCAARLGFRLPDAGDLGIAHFPCGEGLALRHDPAATLLMPLGWLPTPAFDYARRRALWGGLREVRRPLAPPPEWTAGGALGLAIALLVLRRATRLPAALDPAMWRQGVRRAGEREVVFDDGDAPVNAVALPPDYAGPVLASARGERMVAGYRDAPSVGEPTLLAGTLDEVDAVLRDARDVALARALAVAWTAGAPLAASWWAGLL